MEKRGLLTQAGSGWALTELGVAEARRLKGVG